MIQFKNIEIQIFFPKYFLIYYFSIKTTIYIGKMMILTFSSKCLFCNNEWIVPELLQFLL